MLSRAFQLIWFYIALTCHLLAITVHAISLMDYNVQSIFPQIWFLHIGVAILAFPILFRLASNAEYSKLKESGELEKLNPVKLFRKVFINVPRWIKLLALFGVIYAIINFILFVQSQPGTPEFTDGQYILQNNEKFLRVITEQEYHHYQANILRGFSGHWIAFYGISLIILYPFKR